MRLAWDDFTIFSNDGFGPIRATAIGGAPWFVGKDIGEELWYAAPEYVARNYVHEGDSVVCTVRADDGSVQQVALVNERGLYALISDSGYTKAGEFRQWIEEEVLPALRNAGQAGKAGKSREGKEGKGGEG